MKIKLFLYFGTIIPIIFWVTVIICGMITGDYNHLSNLVSELGAVGTKSQYIFKSGLILSAVLSIFFIIGLLSVCRYAGLNKIPVFILFTYSFSIAGAAIFPLPLRLHGILGLPSILLFLSPLLSMFLWKKEEISTIRQFSLLCFIIMSLGFLAFIPEIFSSYAGLKQRLFHIGWSLWFIVLSIKFQNLFGTLKQL